jgi:hypothetical protein
VTGLLARVVCSLFAAGVPVRVSALVRRLSVDHRRGDVVYALEQLRAQRLVRLFDKRGSLVAPDAGLSVAVYVELTVAGQQLLAPLHGEMRQRLTDSECQ